MVRLSSSAGHEDTRVYLRRRELIHGPLTGKVGIASPLT
jgi:hypothetical protein